MFGHMLHEEAVATRLMRVAWLGMLLGLALELLFLLIQALAAHLPTLVVLSADTVQKLSWSSLVCAGLAFGGTLGRHLKVALGVSGLIVAPIAFILTRALHKAMKEALNAPLGPVTPDIDIAIQALLKAVEYAALGIAVARLDEYAWARARHYILTGFGIGTPFACIALFTSLLPTVTDVVLRILSELLAPAGCAGVLYAGQVVGRHGSKKTQAPVELVD